MQSRWRVACVRIPRFPIGAVWRAARRGEGGTGAADAQLLLPLTLSAAMPPPAPSRRSAPSPSAPPSPAPAHWDDLAIVLVDPVSRRVRAASAAAGRAGVRAGLRVPAARALCAELHELAWDDVAVSAAITEASAQLVSASPQVTPVEGAPGLWWVGASGFDALGGERELAGALLRVARRWHPRPRVAVADSCVAARAATWAGATFQQTAGDRALVHVIAPGGDARYLAPAPLALVPMDEELRAALHALGLRTVGTFAALSAEDVERRWGEGGLRAWRLARGEDARRPVLARPIEVPAVEVELAAPAPTMEPVLFVVRAALDRLVAELVGRGRAVAAVAITLTLDDARGPLVNQPVHTVTREARAARPLARVGPLFERCRALLDGWTLAAPVTAVRVAIAATAPLSGEQGDLLTAAWRDLGAADAALERLRAELGSDAIVRAEARDTHRPERAGVWRERASVGGGTEGGGGTRDRGRRAERPTGIATGEIAPHGGEERAGATRTERRGPAAPRVLALHPAPPPTPVATPLPTAQRAFDPPERIEVACERDAPRVVSWRGHHIALLRAVGPERLSGEWWDDGYRRDYWHCESAAGEMTIFLDRSDGGWRLQCWRD